MPSKAELKKEVDDLRANLKETTKRLTALETGEIKLSGKMIEVPLKEEKVNPEIVTVRCPICNAIIEIPGYNKITKSDALSQHIREKHGFRHAGLHNPVCLPAISKIESDIATGKTHWDIVDEQYERWQKGEDSCLPCEKDYVEVKSALTSVGNQYTNLVHPEDIRDEKISSNVREQTARELERAESRAKTLTLSCDIKFPRVRSRLKQMKPLAHVGRWNEFMDNQRQLLSDFELDIRESIPDIRVMTPSYAIPVPIKEIAEIAPSLSEYERKQLAKSLSPEEQRQLEETKKLAEIGRKMAGGV